MGEELEGVPKRGENSILVNAALLGCFEKGAIVIQV